MIEIVRGKEKTLLKQVSFPFPRHPLSFLQKLLYYALIFLLSQKIQGVTQ